ncbi:biotin--[acetyl-CoA-carboxylase] ligase [Ureibacillus sp. FSL K6-3587]|jgi:BirA family biotin operon repressor/biotin-[acetyl-CoA-carboxylase] ligase|uniref:biotin--[acetyl-CoA-carboxylase] ligase n=1 Tax=Ureibacillus sp. FSL K6-3587 TaxID=2954681 RepID=UPI0031587A81
MNLSMKDKILQRFLSAKGEPISGQQLADELGISRTAIWKHLQTLQEEGYEFVTIKKKGYRLVEVPDRVDAAKISSFLNTKRFGHAIHYFEEIDSTQSVAQQLARQGAEDGTVIIAEEQTGGKGRMQRTWHSAKGKGIWMTIIVRPNIPPHQAPQLTLVAAVSVVLAMKSLYKNFMPVIKWPNDILINGKKCAGILTEMLAEMDRVEGLLIGIGINTNHELDDFPEDIQSIATSIAIEEKQKVDRAQLVAEILKNLEYYTDEYVAHGFKSIKKLWEEHSGTIGKRIKATTIREIIEGQAVGITDEGVLEILLDDGQVKKVYSADIEIQNE